MMIFTVLLIVNLVNKYVRVVLLLMYVLLVYLNITEY